MFKHSVIIIFLIVVAAVSADDPLPLTDSTNQGQWIFFEPLSDEFEGSVVDTSKWQPTSWDGRKPIFHNFSIFCSLCSLI